MDVFYRPELSVQTLLMDANTVQETAEKLAAYINYLMSADSVLLVRLDNLMRYKESGSWKAGNDGENGVEAVMRQWLPRLVESWNKREKLSCGELKDFCQALTPYTVPGGYLTILPICNHIRFVGFAVFGKRAEEGDWTDKELPVLRFLLSIIAVTFANKNLYEDYMLQNWVYNTMMGRMQANLYVTDIHTDQILFMNKTMQEAFGLENPVGKVCWQVLQKGIKGRCPGCPVTRLTESGEEGVYRRWEEYNTVTGRYYDNYDSLMKWTDGSTVHFQHSLDITASKKLSKEASTDELTGLLNRRGGKNRLAEMLNMARHQEEVLTVCMYDVNSLKKVNDTFGHREGDNLLRVIANMVKSVLTERDFACRLSGDEFLITFAGKTEQEADELIKLVEERLLAVRRQDRIPYELSFCTGILELKPEHTMSVTDILREVDERMYDQKRQYHMRQGKEPVLAASEAQWRLLKPEAFDYDQQYLYDALVESTDDYLYVCDMATNTFRYSRKLVEEFAFPGEVIQNAADIWRSIIHPADWERFWESNQAVSDGRTVSHEVEYRARNRKGQWIKLHCRGHVAQNSAGEPRVFAGFIANEGQWFPEWTE